MTFATNAFDWTFSFSDVLQTAATIITLAAVYWALKTEVRVLSTSYGITREQVVKHHENTRVNFHELTSSLNALTLTVSTGQVKVEGKLEKITEQLEHLDECVDGIKSESKKDCERLWDDQKRQDEARKAIEMKLK